MEIHIVKILFSSRDAPHISNNLSHNPVECLRINPDTNYFIKKDVEIFYQQCGRVNPITQFLFATEVRGLAKFKLGNKDEPQRIEKKRQVLTSRDVSSFTIDNLRDRPIRQDAAVACFYFYFRLRRSGSSLRGRRVPC